MLHHHAITYIYLCGSAIRSPHISMHRLHNIGQSGTDPYRTNMRGQKRRLLAYGLEVELSRSGYLRGRRAVARHNGNGSGNGNGSENKRKRKRNHGVNASGRAYQSVPGHGGPMSGGGARGTGRVPSGGNEHRGGDAARAGHADAVGAHVVCRADSGSRRFSCSPPDIHLSTHESLPT